MSIALLAALALQSAPASEAPPVPREAHVFADWVVACDNGGRCEAVGVQPEGQENGNNVLTLERGAETEAPLRFRLTQVEGRPARLTVHGNALPVRLVEADGDFAVETENRAALFEQVLYADQIEMQDASNAAIGQISVRGLRHALLYMDEAQRRLHTPTALIRTGRRAYAPPPPAPVVRVAPATAETALTIPPARIARLRRDSRCVIGDVGGPDEVETAGLGGGRTLILLACGTGAYNLSSVPFIATRAGRDIRIEPAPFDVPLEPYEEEEGRRVLINASWSAEAMTISDFSKGRGLGDCGSRSTYGWDGARFRLLDREEMPECRGSIQFVTTWRAEAAR
jgi:hypothetical protein